MVLHKALQNNSSPKKLATGGGFVGRSEGGFVSLSIRPLPEKMAIREAGWIQVRAYNEEDSASLHLQVSVTFNCLSSVANSDDEA